MTKLEQLKSDFEIAMRQNSAPNRRHFDLLWNKIVEINSHKYHNMDLIITLLTMASETPYAIPGDVLLAILLQNLKLHETKTPRLNSAESAFTLLRDNYDWDEPIAYKVYQNILYGGGMMPLDSSAAHEIKLMNDIKNLTLAFPKTTLFQYTELLKREFLKMGLFNFFKAQGDAFAALEKRTRIYNLPRFQDLFESRARGNIKYMLNVNSQNLEAFDDVCEGYCG
jgi:predicted metal-dependent HD superfamily phosphohydrolase